MTTTQTPGELARQQLEGFRFMFLYADRQLIAREQYVAAARRLRTRAVRQALSLFLFSAFLLVLAGFDVAAYARSGLSVSLIAAALEVLMAFSFTMTAVTLRKRSAAVQHAVEGLLPGQVAELDHGAVSKPASA